MRNRGPIFSVGQEGVGFCCFCMKRLASDRLDGFTDFFVQLAVNLDALLDEFTHPGLVFGDFSR